MTEEDIDRAAVYLADPAAFIQAFWPGSYLYDKQYETILSVRDNDETFVHAANELGKTKLASWLVVWWFCTRFPAKIVTSSSAEKQLKLILWSEIDVLLRTAAKPLPIKQGALNLDVLDPERGKSFGDHYCVGHVTNKITNFQGHHLVRKAGDPPRVLFVFDEASGILDEYHEAAQSQAHSMLVIGNPLSTDGFFHRLCKLGDVPDPDKPGRYHRKVIHIDGLDSPNVKVGMQWVAAGNGGMPPTVIPGVLSWGEYKRRERIWDPVKRQMRLHGLFYEGEEFLMFPPLWLDAAEDAWEQIVSMRRGPCWMGVDTAEGGGDLTVWTVIDWYGIVDVIVRQTRDTSVINPITMGLMGKWKVPARRICYDRGGGGKEHVDMLRKMGYRARAVAFGEKPQEPKVFKNRRAEIYGLIRRAINPSKWTKNQPADTVGGGETWRRCFAIPAEGSELFSPELREELAVLPVLYDGEGKQFLPPKNRPANKRQTSSRIKTIQEMIGRSPDRSDSLALAVYARDGGINQQVAKVDGDRMMAADPSVLDKMQPQESGQAGVPRSLSDRLFGQPKKRGGLSSEDGLWG